MLPRLDDPEGLSNRLEDFLDHLIAPTVGRLPRAERERFREETRSHILGYWEDFIRAGESDERALELALREFGEPGKVGARFVSVRAEGRPNQEARRVLGRTAQRAFASFGLAASLNAALLQAYLTPAYPNESILPYLGVLFLVSPLVAGASTGSSAPSRLPLAVVLAVSAVAALTVPTGLALMPNRIGLAMSASIPVFWIPLGLASAWGAAALSRAARASGFWRSEG